MSAPNPPSDEGQQIRNPRSWNNPAEGSGPTVYEHTSDSIEGKRSVVSAYTPIQRTSPMSYKAPSFKKKIPKPEPEPVPSRLNKISTTVGGYITSPVRYISSMFSSRPKELIEEVGKKSPPDIVKTRPVSRLSALPIPRAVGVDDHKQDPVAEPANMEGIKDLKLKLETVANTKTKRHPVTGTKRYGNKKYAASPRSGSPHEMKGRKSSSPSHEVKKPLAASTVKIEQSTNKSSYRIKSAQTLGSQEKQDALAAKRAKFPKYPGFRTESKDLSDIAEPSLNDQLVPNRPRPYRFTSGKKDARPVVQSGEAASSRYDTFSNTVQSMRKLERDGPNKSNSASSHLSHIKPAVETETTKDSETANMLTEDTLTVVEESSKPDPPANELEQPKQVEPELPPKIPESPGYINSRTRSKSRSRSIKRAVSPTNVKSKEAIKKPETPSPSPQPKDQSDPLDAAKSSSSKAKMQHGKVFKVPSPKSSPRLAKRSRSVSRSPGRKSPVRKSSKSSVGEKSITLVRKEKSPVQKGKPPVTKRSASPVNISSPHPFRRSPNRVAEERRSKSPVSRASRSKSPVRKDLKKNPRSKHSKSFQARREEQMFANRPYNPNKPTPTVIPSPKVERKVIIVKQKKNSVSPTTVRKQPLATKTPATIEPEEEPRTTILSQLSSNATISDPVKENSQTTEARPGDAAVAVLAKESSPENDLCPLTESFDQQANKSKVNTDEAENNQSSPVIKRKELVSTNNAPPEVKRNPFATHAVKPEKTKKIPFTNKLELLNDPDDQTTNDATEARRFPSPWRTPAMEIPSRCTRFPDGDEVEDYKPSLPSVLSPPVKSSAEELKSPTLVSDQQESENILSLNQPSTAEKLVSSAIDAQTPSDENLNAPTALSENANLVNTANDQFIKQAKQCNHIINAPLQERNTNAVPFFLRSRPRASGPGLNTMEKSSSLSQYSGDPVAFASAATMLGELP